MLQLSQLVGEYRMSPVVVLSVWSRIRLPKRSSICICRATLVDISIFSMGFQLIHALPLRLSRNRWRSSLRSAVKPASTFMVTDCESLCVNEKVLIRLRVCLYWSSDMS